MTVCVLPGRKKKGCFARHQCSTCPACLCWSISGVTPKLRRKYILILGPVEGPEAAILLEREEVEEQAMLGIASPAIQQITHTRRCKQGRSLQLYLVQSVRDPICTSQSLLDSFKKNNRPPSLKQWCLTSLPSGILLDFFLKWHYQYMI